MNELDVEINVLDQAVHEVIWYGASQRDPNGLPYFTFAHFARAITLLDEVGEREYPGGVCVLWFPGAPRYIGAESQESLITWIDLTGDGIGDVVDRYGVPLNRVFRTGELPFLAPLFDEIFAERVEQAPFWEDAVADLVRTLFRKLGSVRAVQIATTPHGAPRNRKLHEIREHVHAELAQQWTVPRMASLAGVSPNWFSAAYRRAFGISPIDDLLDCRLRQAAALLRSTPLTVHEIAYTCGFPHVEHFARLFKKRLACTPGEYRRRSRSE